MPVRDTEDLHILRFQLLLQIPRGEHRVRVEDDRFSATTYYGDGSYSYDNGNGYSEYHDGYGYNMTSYADGSYDIEENGIINHYDRFGNLIGMQVFNGSYYETIF